MSAKSAEEGFVGGQEGRPVTVGFGVVNGEGEVSKVNVLDPQPQAFRKAQAGTVHEASGQIGDAAEVVENAANFSRRQVGLDVVGFLGAEGGDIAERLLEHLGIEEQQCGQGLILGAGRDFQVSNQVSQEGFHFGLAQVVGVAQFVKADEADVPLDIGLFGAVRVAAQADGGTELIGEFGWLGA